MQTDNATSLVSWQKDLTEEMKKEEGGKKEVGSQKRDFLRGIEKDIQKKWSEAKVFELDAPPPVFLYIRISLFSEYSFSHLFPIKREIMEKSLRCQNTWQRFLIHI